MILRALLLAWERHKEKRLLRKKFDAWKAEHLRPGEYINLAYFVQVLDSGENEHARKWGKP